MADEKIINKNEQENEILTDDKLDKVVGGTLNDIFYSNLDDPCDHNPFNPLKA